MKFIPVAEPVIGNQEARYVMSALKSTWISSSGAFIDKFESSFAQFCNVRYATSCSNGTAALHLALLALDIGSGNEVILPSFTFIATANAIRYVGAIPVFVDIDPKTWNIDPEQIEKKITSRTKAIIPVHIYGYPSDMDKIKKIARKHSLGIIEDAAEAHAATYKNQTVGTIGDIGCFSFFGNKIITTGEGGMIVTNNRTLMRKIILLKNHGMSPKRKYYHPVIGYNYRMTNIQAAIGLAQLEKVPRTLARRQKIEALYRRMLKNTPGIVFQPLSAQIKHVCWLFSILITPAFGSSRNKLITYLKVQQIDSRPFFYPITYFPMYKCKEIFPIAERISKMGINLPSSPNLTNTQITYITQTINNFAAST
jgi:perosamine synthetase